MEPAEDASLEPAIGWLAQSILASPLINEQAPWVREAGLAEEVDELNSEIKAVQLVVSAVKGRALGNVPLAESLAELKELLYNADDAVDELDYWRLLQLDQEVTQHDLDQTDGHHGASQADRSIENTDVTSRSGTLPDPHETDGQGMQLVGTQSSSVGKLRSKKWEEFEILEFNQNGAPVRAKCIHCGTEIRCPTNQGTGVLHNHLTSKACLSKKCEGSNPLSTAEATRNPAPSLATGNLSSKKRRRDEESTSLITANTSRWNKDDFSKMIRDIALKLRHIREGVILVLSILGSDFAASSNHSQGATSHQRRRTTSTLQGRVYGRDVEKNGIIKVMEDKLSAIGVTVLPILGIAGVGKTALAQLVYNDPAVKDLFDLMVWIWVSNNFDSMELTKDMLDYVSEGQVWQCNFAKLQEILKSHIKSERVLLILDDVWDGINDYQWNQLLAPFNSDNARGNMIIVTTRKPCVAKKRGTVTPITLGALKCDDFWLYFEACAFGDVNHEKQESLSDLGQQIAQKLKGNPLAAETAGALLSEHRTVAHWSSILKNEDWKSLTLSGGIMSALKLCYDKLPYHLQQCFTYCSLAPCNNYEFLAEELVRIWISQGFVKCNNSSKRLEEIGQDYLADLVNLGFFGQFEKSSSSGCTQICYVMYDLMHDFARVVSRTECATIDGLLCNRMFPAVRHLSIISNSIYLARTEKFEEILRNTVTSVGKLRSLVLIGQFGSSFFQFIQTAFQKSHNLRLLYLSVKSADSHSSLWNLVNPAHLRYLKLEYGPDEQGAFSQVVSKSFHLQVLDVEQNYSSAGLASLQTVHLDNSGEPRILPSLGRLRCLTRLKLSNMWNIREVSVPSLEELVLFEMPELKRCSCTSAGGLRSSLRVLEIQSCPALAVVDLFQEIHNYETEGNLWFPSLKKLIIQGCPALHGTIPLPPSATVVEIEGLNTSQTLRIKPNSVLGEMTLDDKFLSFHNMRDLKYLEIKGCYHLVPISLRTFGHLISLKKLKIKNCLRVLSSDEDLILSNDSALPSLESLHIELCGLTGKWITLMLWHSPTLKELRLEYCTQLTQLQIEEDKNSQSNLSSAPDGLCCIPLNLTSSLKKITLYNCRDLIFDGSWKGFASFTSLEKLRIQGCPNLLSSLVHKDGQGNVRWLLPQSLEELIICECSHEFLRRCFVGILTRLRKSEVSGSPRLKSLHLELCTAMGYLNVVNSPVLASLATSGESLKCLHISELSLLTTSFCEGLSCLRSLHLEYLEEARLTAEQERALLLLGSLQELFFYDSMYLEDLPAGLLGLPSLKTLKIEDCWAISGLPEAGLPPSLEELEIESCSYELSEQCRSLATYKLTVIIDGRYVN